MKACNVNNLDIIFLIAYQNFLSLCSAFTQEILNYPIVTVTEPAQVHFESIFFSI